MSKTNTPRLRSDETGKHAVTDSPVGQPAQDPDIETFDKKRSEGVQEKGDEKRHERRPEGPYKDPADERKQGEVK